MLNPLTELMVCLTCKTASAPIASGRCPGCRNVNQRIPFNVYVDSMVRVALHKSGAGHGIVDPVYLEAVKGFKRRMLLDAIKAEDGYLSKAALRVGVHRNTMTRLMREVGLTSQQVREYLSAQKAAATKTEKVAA